MPATAQCEFIFANRCQLSTVNLGGLQSLRELSLTHNNISDLSFLSYAGCCLEKLYIDHNKLSGLDWLLGSLLVLTAGFNNVSGLEAVGLELGRTKLSTLDLSFNPIRG